MTLDATQVISWILDDARESEDDPAFLAGFARCLVEHGVRLFRVGTSLRPIDPQVWVRNLRWERGQVATDDREREVRNDAEYLGSPIEAIHQGADRIRERLEHNPVPRFHTLATFASRGATDYLILAIAGHEASRTFVAYASEAAGGFRDDELALLEAIHPAISCVVRLRTSRMTTSALLRTYLGQNAAKRVLSGQVERGRGETISAAIWFCDLRDFTVLSNELPAARLLQLLDRYFETVSGAVVDEGGEILKFIGDAMLAIFPVGEAGPADACRRALGAAITALDRFEVDVATLARPIAFGTSLHIGEVFYGNIGARDRLDFTVIGPAVNLAARVQGQCTALATPLLMTSTFTAYLERTDLRSLGSHALKGIPTPPELATLTRFG